MTEAGTQAVEAKGSGTFGVTDMDASSERIEPGLHHAGLSSVVLAPCDQVAGVPPPPFFSTGNFVNYPSSTQLLINGEWQDASSGETLPVFNPATGREIGRVALSGREDLDRALGAAEKGFEIWRRTPAFERAALMLKAAQILRERLEPIASLMTQEQGKPIAEARTEVLGGIGVIEWAAAEATRIYGRVIESRVAETELRVLRKPVGPVAAFTPWNFPINQIVRKLAAALATGNSILIKGPEETPASPAELLRAFVEAGIPSGVVGLLFGNPGEISSYLISHPVIRKITFTGSTEIGKKLAAMAGQYMKRATMELGGHAPVILARDADVGAAVKILGAAKFRNAGQVCISPTRFLVHESIVEEFTQRMVQYVRALNVGNGLDADVTMGPLAHERRVSAMSELLEASQKGGAKLVHGGTPIGRGGNFFSPTVLGDVPSSAQVFNAEPFGPIVAIQPFNLLDEAISEANRLPYGLAAYAFTHSIGTVHRIVEEVDVGMLWINQGATPFPEVPFGGIKDSGYGSEGGPEAFESYLTPKSVGITAKFAE